MIPRGIDFLRRELQRVIICLLLFFLHKIYQLYQSHKNLVVEKLAPKTNIGLKKNQFWPLKLKSRVLGRAI